MPVLPDGPSPERVQAWVELAYIVVDDFRAVSAEWPSTRRSSAPTITSWAA